MNLSFSSPSHILSPPRLKKVMYCQTLSGTCCLFPPPNAYRFFFQHRHFFPRDDGLPSELWTPEEFFKFSPPPDYDRKPPVPSYFLVKRAYSLLTSQVEFAPGLPFPLFLPVFDRPSPPLHKILLPFPPRKPSKLSYFRKQAETTSPLRQ